MPILDHCSPGSRICAGPDPGLGGASDPLGGAITTVIHEFTSITCSNIAVLQSCSTPATRTATSALNSPVGTVALALFSGPEADVPAAGDSLLGTISRFIRGLLPSGKDSVGGALTDAADSAGGALGRELPPIAGGAPILGEGGVQVTSRTLLRDTGQGFRIDVENPAPGVRPGQLHLQDIGGGKYLYDFQTNQFEGLPPGLARRVADDPQVAAAIAKARDYLNVPQP
jgi:hypothetical protein